MNWKLIISALLLIGAVYYIVLLIQQGKGLDVLAWLVILGIGFIIVTFILFVKQRIG